MKKKKGHRSAVMVMLVVMLVLCGCGTRQKLPARKTDGKIKIGVSVYDQYDAFVAELMQDLNDQVLGAKAEEKQISCWRSIMPRRARRSRTNRCAT